MRSVKLFEEGNAHRSNEQKAQREDAKRELFEFEPLTSDPPIWLAESAKSEWRRLVPVMKKDYPLSETDYGLLIAYCLSYSRVKTAEREIKKNGTFITNQNNGTKKVNPAVAMQSQAFKDMKSAASALGMTLEARSRMALNKAKEQKELDPFQELIES